MKKPLATLPAVRPNAGLQKAYKRRILRLSDEMARSVEYWVTAAYRANEPRVVEHAMDAEFKESEHPRKDDGRFGKGSGRSGTRKPKYEPDLSTPGGAALNDYQYSKGTLGLGINAVLRSNPNAKGLSGEEKNFIKNLDTEIRDNKTKSPATVYRGIDASTPYGKRIVNMIKNGTHIDATFYDPGYLSTSAHRATGATIANAAKEPMLFEIDSSGTKSLDTGAGENLFGRGSALSIVSAEYAPIDDENSDEVRSGWIVKLKLKTPGGVALAKDAAPADVLSDVIDELHKRWTRRFDTGAEELAKYFAQAAYKRSDKQLQAILKRAGFSVEFKMTAVQRDIVAAAVNENVALIKSIPDQYFKDIEGAVMRSVSIGRRVGDLAAELKKTYGVTRRRAELISLDQNNKATATLTRSRQIEIGCEEAIWMHSHAGKKPRPTHVKKNGQRYNIREGWFDPDANEICWPGTLINCRCTSKPIIPGFIQ